MMEELSEVLDLIEAGEGGSLPGCEGAPREYLRLGHVALSGHGEPTLCPLFEEVVDELLHLRAQGQHGCFKIALITNATGLQRPAVQRSLRRLMSSDEIWAKLDAGSPEWFEQLNRPEVDYPTLLAGLLATAQQRQVVIQSLFPRWHGRAVPPHEQEAYVQRLASLQQAGARIRLVQIYSASRPPATGRCSHATLAELSSIARRVKEVTGLPVQVY
jgi:wyosine [tRNA(Phe)-imidazoG37] synthetase (radical SAM superfamily)